MLRLASCSAASILCILHKSAGVPQSKKQPCRIVQGSFEVRPRLNLYQ